MLNGPDSTRMCSGIAVPTGTPVAASSAYPGAAMFALSTSAVTTSDATTRIVIVTWPTRQRCRHVTYATTIAAIVAKAMTLATAISGAGWPSRTRRAWLRSAKRPPMKIVPAAKYPKRVRASR